MSLQDELALEKPPNHCNICVWLSEQPKTDQKAFKDWVVEGRPAAALLRACKRQGMTHGIDALHKHIKEQHP